MENKVLDAIKNRRSIRSYKEEQIKEEELQAIIEAGLNAPSANNEQSWHLTVIQDKKFIKNISEKSSEVMASSTDERTAAYGKSKKDILYGAPTIIIVSGDEKAGSPLVDCSAAIENMLLAAYSLNIGSLWIGMIRHYLTLKDEVKKLNLPEGYKPYYAVALGYKNLLNNPVAPEKKKNTVNFIR